MPRLMRFSCRLWVRPNPYDRIFWVCPAYLRHVYVMMAHQRCQSKWQVASLRKTILTSFVLDIYSIQAFGPFWLFHAFSAEHPPFLIISLNCASILSTSAPMWPNLVAVRLIQGHTLIPSTCKFVAVKRQNTENIQRKYIKHIQK